MQELEARLPGQTKTSNRLHLSTFAAQHLQAEANDGTLIPLAPGCDFHRELCRDLEAMTLSANRPIRLNWLAPRGSAKSSYSTFAFPLWLAAYNLEPYVMIASETQTLACKLLRNIRSEIERNDVLRTTFPGISKGPLWRDDALQFANGVLIQCIGTGGSVRGSRERASRPSLVIIDDCQDKKTIWSELQRSRDWDWLTRDLLPLGSPRTNFVNVATALHRECVACKLQEHTGWKTKVYKAIEVMPSRLDLWVEWENILHSRLPEDGKEATERAAERARVYYEQNRVEMDS